MIEHPNDDRAEELLGTALLLADDIRTDIAAAHRTVRYMDRGDLEALACVLAACVPVDQPLSSLAWWRLHVVTPAPLPAAETKPARVQWGSVAGRAGQIRELAAEGWTDQQMADEFGCTKSAVAKVRARFGIPAGELKRKGEAA